MSAGRAQLSEYVADTLARLGRDPPQDVGTLGSQVIPSVVADVLRLSAAAPGAFKDKVSAVFTDAAVLPRCDADVTAVKVALRQILAMIPADQAPNAVEIDGKAVVVSSPGEPPSADLVRTAGASGQGDQRGKPRMRDQFLAYVEKTSRRLADPGCRGTPLSAEDFSARVLPQVLKSLRNFTAGAPADLRAFVFRVLATSQLWPYLALSGDGPQKLQVQDLVLSGDLVAYNLSKVAMPAEGGSETKPHLQAALRQIGAFLREFKQAELIPFATGLASPVRIQLRFMSSDPVACFSLERGTSAGTFRNIVASFLDCPPALVSFAQAQGALGDADLFTADAEVMLIRTVADSLAGVYAGYSSNILAFYPEGQTAAGFYDDWWDNQRRPIRDVVRGLVPEWTQEPTLPQGLLDNHAVMDKGSWAESSVGSCRLVSGNAYEPGLDNMFSFQFIVMYDPALREGTSDVVLVGKVKHRFGFTEQERQARDDEREEWCRYYLVAKLPAEA